MKNSPLSIATIAEKAKLVQCTLEETKQLTEDFVNLLSERELNNLINQLRVIDEARRNPGKPAEQILLENFFAQPVPKKERVQFILDFNQDKEEPLQAVSFGNLNVDIIKQIASLQQHREQQKEKDSSQSLGL